MKAKPFLLIVCLVGITAMSMVVAAGMNPAEPAASVNPVNSKKSILTGRVNLTQSKVLKDGDGTVAAAVTLTSNQPKTEVHIHRPVDLIVVLDRSGSMQGDKMNYAKEALNQLIQDLSDTDRLALITYSNGATIETELTAMTPDNRKRMVNIIRTIRVGGGTNLGEGLLAGVNLMPPPENTSTIRHLLVISDGLANQGITDTVTLGQMVARAGDKNLSVGTVGVGDDFNEHLMTLLADRGQGRYYYLENPVAFAGLFTEEYRRLAMVTATNIRLKIQLGQQVTLKDASGYPVKYTDDDAYVKIGNIINNASRTIYLTFKVPTHRTGAVDMGKITLSYRYQDQVHTLPLELPLPLTCIDNPDAVFASIEKENWAHKVLQNDYSRLKKEVAEDITNGNQSDALKRIETYRVKQAELNNIIGSEKVQENLDHEVDSLRQQVEETFSGTKAQVRQKQKRTAKSLHYDGYIKERAIK